MSWARFKDVQVSAQRWMQVVVVVFLQVGCGGASKTTTDQAAVRAALIANFVGIKSLEKTEDHAWVLKWDPVVADEIIYAVYRAKNSEAFNFSVPYLTTRDSSYTFKPANVFSLDVDCFTVRIGGSTDANTTKLCTTSEALTFGGVKEIERQSDGGYLLKWETIPLSGTSFTVYERDDVSTYNFDLPAFDGISENFQKIALYPRGEKHCFVVRYYHVDLPDDANTTELCTTLESEIEFAGVKEVRTLSSTSLTVFWTQSDSKEVKKYRVYQGSSFRELMGEVESTAASLTITGLAPGRQYGFGVRAVDEYDRTDGNLAILPTVMPTN